MKKSLFALAAFSALTGAAQAQSSVTVYGIIDVGYLATSGQTGAASSAAVTTAQLQSAAVLNGQKTTSGNFNSGNLATSRLGFRGTEDVGGGVKVNFVAEIGLTPTDTSFSGSSNVGSTPLGATYATNSQILDNRQSYLGLEKSGFGEIRIGSQYTAVHEAQCAINLGLCNGVIGDAMYIGSNSTNTKTSAYKRDDSYLIRVRNAFEYRTPTIAGFSGVGIVSNNTKSVDNAGTARGWQEQNGLGDVNYQQTGLRLSYDGIKNLRVEAAQQRTRLTRSNMTTDAVGAPVVIGGTQYDMEAAAMAQVQNQLVDTYFGAAYDLGMAKVSIANISQVMKSTGDIQALKRTANQVQVSVPVTSAISAYATFGNGKRQAAITAQNYGFAGYQAGALYSLSKRTSLYAIYGHTTMDAQAGQASNFQDTQYALGARHTF